MGTMQVTPETSRGMVDGGWSDLRNATRDRKNKPVLPPYIPPSILTSSSALDSMKSSNQSLGKGLGQYPVVSPTSQMTNLDPKRYNLFSLPTVTQLIKSPSPMLPSNAKQSVLSSSEWTSTFFVRVSEQFDSACTNENNLGWNSRLWPR